MICGSSPDPDVVTMSPGTFARSASAWSWRHISKKIDWTSEPLATGSIAVALFPLGNCWATADGNLPGYSFEKFSKNMTAKSDGWGCGVPGFCLIQSVTSA